MVRYAEPVDDLNPVQLNIAGISKNEQPAFLEDMRHRLNDENCCLAYRWESGDIARERIRYAINHYWDMRAGRLPKTI